MTAVTPGRDAILSLLDLFESDIDHIHVTPHRREILTHTLRLVARPADEEVREATIEECAKVCDRWISSRNLHESLAATDIKRDIFRLSTTGAPKP